MREYQEINLPDNPNTIIKINNIPEFDYEDYNLSDPKDINKLLKRVEKICRNSRCYRKFVNFLKDHSNMNKCSFYKNINMIDTNYIQIHLHHTPFTLFDIVNTVLNKRMRNNESLSEFQIAKEVMYNHYKMKIGLIPLSETVHELVHNGFLFIPTNVVFGYYKNFVIEYEPYIEPGLLQILKYNEKMTETYDFQKESKVLTMDLVYIDTSGAYEFPKKEEIIKLFKEKIEKLEIIEERGI